MKAEKPGASPPIEPSKAWRRVLLDGRPKYVALGLLLGCGRLLSSLPYPMLIAFGRGLGHLAYLFARKGRRVAATNISLSYPELSPDQQRKLVRASFVELGISIYETLYVWFHDLSSFNRDRVRTVGREHWQAALAEERGVILLSCHYGSLDLNATLAALADRGDRSMSFTYRAPSDEIVNRFILDVRTTLADNYFPVENLIGVMRELKRGGIVWYAPDIEIMNKNTVFAEFLGTPASTTIAIGKLAGAVNAIVLPFAHYREADGKTYTLRFFPPLREFPSGDPAADTRRINAAIEEIIEPHPERYWWVIKRFKHMPDGSKRPY